MKLNVKIVFFIVLLFNISTILKSQDVESFFGEINERIEAGEWVKVNGAISTMGSFNQINGIEQRQDPFSFRLNAAINFDVLGIKAPFSASISDGNKVYKLPSYAFYGISPSYKWIKLHLGDRSMNFSKYTLAGHNFRGAGMELKPGRFRFAAMYGQLKRAVAEDLNNRQNLETAYERKGWGTKIGYEHGESSYHLVVFQAKDDATSIPALTENLPSNLRPQENTVLSFIGKQKLGDLFTLSFDYALSGLTRDSESALMDKNQYSLLKRMGGLYTPKASSGFYKAFNTKLDVNTKIGQINFNHEWVDPGYKTLGALFFANDLESFTTGITTSLLKKKINLSGNAGIQRNNLNGVDNNSNRRFLGTINMGINLSEKMNLNLNYSNASATNKLRAVSIPFIEVDSLILVQTNQSASVSSIYTFINTEEKQSMLISTFSFQNANSIENDEIKEDQSTTYYLGQLSYVFGLPKKNWNVTTSLLINYGEIPNLNLLTLAPNISMKWKVLDEKMDIGATVNYSTIFTNNIISNKVYAIRLNTGYKLFEKHSLNASLNYTKNAVSNQPYVYSDFSEFTGTLSYHWKF